MFGISSDDFTDCLLTNRNPTPDDDSTLEGLRWPVYNLEKKQYLSIGKDVVVKADVNKDRFQFWDHFFERWERISEKDEDRKIDKKDEL